MEKIGAQPEAFLKKKNVPVVWSTVPEITETKDFQGNLDQVHLL